jgi:hypothetical protein
MSFKKHTQFIRSAFILSIAAFGILMNNALSQTPAPATTIEIDQVFTDDYVYDQILMYQNKVVSNEFMRQLSPFGCVSTEMKVNILIEKKSTYLGFGNYIPGTVEFTLNTLCTNRGDIKLKDFRFHFEPAHYDEDYSIVETIITTNKGTEKNRFYVYATKSKILTESPFEGGPIVINTYSTPRK